MPRRSYKNSRSRNTRSRNTRSRNGKRLNVMRMSKRVFRQTGGGRVKRRGVSLRNPHRSGGLEDSFTTDWQQRSDDEQPNELTARRANLIINNSHEDIKNSSISDNELLEVCKAPFNKGNTQLHTKMLKYLYDSYKCDVSNYHDKAVKYQKNNIESIMDLQKASLTNEPAPTTGVSTSSASLPPTITAQYDYDKKSTNPDFTVLQFKKRDTFTVLKKNIDYPGWTYVRDSVGKEGYIPKNFTKIN